jgi:hypothetical protein
MVLAKVPHVTTRACECRMNALRFYIDARIPSAPRRNFALQIARKHAVLRGNGRTQRVRDKNALAENARKSSTTGGKQHLKT